MQTIIPSQNGLAEKAPPEAAAFYVTSGTLGAEAASYVERQADQDLLGALTAGEYWYVLNSRQMGKSSLCVRTIARLKHQGTRLLAAGIVRQPSQEQAMFRCELYRQHLQQHLI